jgi:chorismate mutase
MNEAIQPLKDSLRDHLERIKQPINAEIRSYPLPAAGCDAQYNHLIEQRSGLAKEIAELDSLNSKGALDKFIDGSAYIDEETANKVSQT